MTEVLAVAAIPVAYAGLIWLQGRAVRRRREADVRRVVAALRRDLRGVIPLSGPEVRGPGPDSTTCAAGDAAARVRLSPAHTSRPSPLRRGAGGPCGGLPPGRAAT